MRGISKDNYNIRIKFWGTRGSIPTPGKYFVKYGGNTPCVEVRCGDTIHHDPLRTDEELDIMIYNASKFVKPPMRLYAAIEKNCIYL